MKKTAKLTKIGKLIQEYYLNSVPEELKNNNTPTNRKKIETSFNHLLDKLTEDKVINNYHVQCDERNNTAEVLKKNETQIDIYYQIKKKWRILQINIEQSIVNIQELKQN